MRIGLIAPPWMPVPPPAYGGTEAIVDRLARGLTAAGHEVLLAASGDSTVPVPRVEILDTAPTHTMGDSLIELRYVIGAYDALDQMDLVHDHTLLGPLCRCRPAGLPVVTTMHGPFTDDAVAVYRAVSRDAHIVAISADQASSAFGLPIARVIHHGLDVEDVPIGAGDGGYALFLGRMCPDKGAREAVLAARRAGVHLLLAGKMREPSEHGYFTDQVRPLLGAGAEYIGEASVADRYRLLGGATCLLNPIQWPEPFGLVMIEALACGTPVVATSCGSVPELIEDGVTGLIRSSETGLAAALHEAADLDRRACREAAEKRFNTQRMVDDHLQLYQDVLAGRLSLSRPGSGRGSTPRPRAAL